jgi:CBS-domain-containing membrane protein
MSVREIFRRDVDCAEADETIAVAARRMHQRCVGSLVVVDTDRRPIGIVTDRDLVTRVLAPALSPETTTLGDVMTPAPETVTSDVDWDVAIERMKALRCRRLPVVDLHGRIEGIVTLDDILVHLRDLFSRLGTLVELESPRGVVAVHAAS